MLWENELQIIMSWQKQVEDVKNGRGRLTWIAADLMEETIPALKAKFQAGGVAEATQWVTD